MSKDPATSGKTLGLGHSLHCKLVVTASLFCKAATFFLAKLSRTCCQGLVAETHLVKFNLSPCVAARYSTLDAIRYFDHAHTHFPP